MRGILAVSSHTTYFTDRAARDTECAHIAKVFPVISPFGDALQRPPTRTRGHERCHDVSVQCAS